MIEERKLKIEKDEREKRFILVFPFSILYLPSSK
jgi:hypothetical protein